MCYGNQSLKPRLTQVASVMCHLCVTTQVGPERVGVKLQPGVTFSDLIEPAEDVFAQIKYLCPELAKRKLAFVELSSLNDAPYYKFLGEWVHDVTSMNHEAFKQVRASMTGSEAA